MCNEFLELCALDQDLLIMSVGHAVTYDVL